MKKNAEYYFGVEGGKRMKAMKRRELYALFAGMYQLAGSFLIGAKVLEENYATGQVRTMNGWTQDEMDEAIEVLLNFLSRPYDMTHAQIENARRVFHQWPVSNE